MKKSIDRKSVQRLIIDNRSLGKTDQEIYDQLSMVYFDKKSIALLITSTIKEELKRKYKLLNYILIGLLLSTVVFKIISIVGISLDTHKPWLLITIFFFPILNVYFIYQIANYYGPIYRFCGLIVIAGFLKMITESTHWIDICINLILSVGIAGIAFYLDQHMFPDYKPNKLIKNENGEFILS